MKNEILKDQYVNKFYNPPTIISKIIIELYTLNTYSIQIQVISDRADKRHICKQRNKTKLLQDETTTHTSTSYYSYKFKKKKKENLKCI